LGLRVRPFGALYAIRKERIRWTLNNSPFATFYLLRNYFKLGHQRARISSGLSSLEYSPLGNLTLSLLPIANEELEKVSLILVSPSSAFLFYSWEILAKLLMENRDKKLQRG
jgi:hypothetical protein